jgi:isoleucyl-tRNA synthetase
VVIDTNLTPELIEEGFVRELISKIQTMRKEAGFEVMDKIRVSVKNNDRIVEILKKFEQEILSDVMADEIAYDAAAGYTKDWNINGEVVTLSVEKL